MKLKAVRKSQNLNAMELAEKAGLDLNQPLMSAVESGKVLFTPDDLQSVCEALQCTPLDLFDNADEFDLMAVQRRMGGSVKMTEPTDEEKEEMTKQAFSKFGVLPPPNPKRSFRMSDEDWDGLRCYIGIQGYNTIGAFLHDISKLGKDILKRKQA